MSRYINQHRARFGVEPICRTLAVSAWAYYRRATGARLDRAREDERLTRRIRGVHRANYKAYGYRRVWRALRRAGETAGRDRVARLMRSVGIRGVKRRGKPWRPPNPKGGRAGGLIWSNASSTPSTQPAVGGRHQLPPMLGRSAVLRVRDDAFSRMVAGLQLAAHMRTTLVLDALKMALGLRGAGADLQLVHHSDRGSQT